MVRMGGECRCDGEEGEKVRVYSGREIKVRREVRGQR